MDEKVKFTATVETTEQREVEAAVEAEVNRFNKFMQTLSFPAGTPLIKSEKALVRTYLLAKVKGEL
jgi:acylphosphatase